MTICRFDYVGQSLNSLISNVDPPSLLKNKGGAMSSRLKEKKPRKARLKRITEKPPKMVENLDFGSSFENDTVILTLPLRTVSEANCFEPWQKKHKRHKAQKKAVFFALLEHKHLISSKNCRLTFIRYAPGTLNAHDNLRMALKYIVDQTCAEIMQDFRPGRADDGDNFTFVYDQVKSKVYGVKIIIEF